MESQPESLENSYFGLEVISIVSAMSAVNINDHWIAELKKMLAPLASVANIHRNCLIIVDKSEITTHPSNVTKKEGENVTLHCNATGYPLPTLSWTKAGSDISNNPRISFSADKKQLAITKASRADSGAYRCVANNSLGNDTSMAAVVDVQCKLVEFS